MKNNMSIELNKRLRHNYSVLPNLQNPVKSKKYLYKVPEYLDPITSAMGLKRIMDPYRQGVALL
jgi:hypothetical protein